MLRGDMAKDQEKRKKMEETEDYEKDRKIKKI